jgi:hypothetical protein
MDRRLFALVAVGLALQAGPRLSETTLPPTLVALAGGLLAVSVVAALLAGAGSDLGGRTSPTTTGGVSSVALGLAFALVPFGGSPFAFLGDGALLALRVGVGLFLAAAGVGMVLSDERRLTEPGESSRSRIEAVGWSDHPVRVVGGELMRSIGVFGLLFVPATLVDGPPTGLGDPVLFVPLAAALCTATVTAAIRLRTGAGPQVGQVLEAATWWGSSDRRRSER